MIQGKLNSKVSSIMSKHDNLKNIARGIKPLMSGGANSSGYESQGYGLNRGYESPTSSKK